MSRLSQGVLAFLFDTYFVTIRKKKPDWTFTSSRVECVSWSTTEHKTRTHSAQGPPVKRTTAKCAHRSIRASDRIPCAEMFLKPFCRYVIKCL
jgi:hypothetical protein